MLSFDLWEVLDLTGTAHICCVCSKTASRSLCAEHTERSQCYGRRLL